MGSAAAVPTAHAASCPTVHVVFARGTGERPGLGWVGSTFVDKLRWKLFGRSITTYAVNYPAGWDFSKSASAGAADANAHIQAAVAECPQTKLVLGGMSQGAGVIDLITVGQRNIWFFKPAPLPPAVADHIAAVVVFSNPARDYSMLGPITRISPEYGPKALDLCATGDPYCSNGGNFWIHMTYPWTSLVDEGATFAARRVLGLAA